MLEMERRLGLPSVTAISLGAMLGAYFVLPGMAASITGPGMWIAFLIAGICVLPAALSKAELATAMPTSGGSFVYLERAFGPAVGTICGLGLWMSLLLKSAFALVGLTWYLEMITPVSGIATGIGFLLVITGLNIFGVKKVGQAQVVMVGVSLAGLIYLIGAGSQTFDLGLMKPTLPDGMDGLITCVAVVFLSYAGVTKIAAVAEEVRNPSRNLPLGMLLSLCIATTIYVAVSAVLAGNIPATVPMGDGGLQGDFRPIYTLAERLGGPAIGTVFAVLGALTMVSMANAGLLASSRFPFSMARSQLLPAPIGAVRSRFLTPIPAILLTSAVMGLAIVTLDVVKIAKLASAFKILAFIAINLSVIVLRESDVGWYRPKFKSPLYPWVQVIGIVVCVVLLTFIGLPAWLATGGVVLVGLALYFGFGRRHASHRAGVASRLVPRESTGSTISPTPSQAALDELKVGVMITLVDRNPPEPLIELGYALSGGESMAAVRIREIPEQLAIEDLKHDHPYERALRRRSLTIAGNLRVPLEYVNAACRDLRDEVLDLANMLRPEWVLFEWQEQGRHAVWLRSPLAWIFSHLHTRVAVFKDEGIRVFRQIMVVIDEGTHDEELVRTADTMAFREGRPPEYNGVVTIATHVAADADEEAIQSRLRELAKLCQVETRLLVLRGGDRVEKFIDQSANFDLMLIEEPPFEALYARVMRRSAAAITGKASCSVLRLRIPENRK